MGDATAFALTLLLGAVAVGFALLSNNISDRIRVPASAIFLLGAAVVAKLWPSIGGLSMNTVQRVVTVALVVILFDGGMHIGARRFRQAAGAITLIGVVGTFTTTAALTVAARFLFGFDWLPALVLGAALAPTDPAVVFSVLGKREITGRAGVILEGESGANDPVGIALMASVLTVAASAGAGAVSTGAGGAVFGNGVIGNGVLTFAAQLIIGAIGGLAGGFGLRWLMRHLPLPSGALYPLRTLAAAIGIYGVCTIAHGSGFLAVFIAGILVGDERAPYKGDIERVHAALASLAEIVAFTLLGLTIDLTELARSRVLLVGLALAALLALVIRPLLVGPLLLGVRLKHGERLFVLFAGLKGAVPILLGSFALTAHIDGAARIYHVIACVVVFSVIVQGGLVPTVARLVGVPMRTTELEPWALGVRLRHEPTTLRRYVVGRGASAVGSTISELPIGEQMWISMVIRDGRLVPVSGDTVLAVDDEVLALVDGESEGESDRESDGESDRESGGESDRESGGESGADPGALFRSPRP